MPYIICQACNGSLVRQGSNLVNGSPFAFAQVTFWNLQHHPTLNILVNWLHKQVGPRTLFQFQNLLHQTCV